MFPRFWAMSLLASSIVSAAPPKIVSHEDVEFFRQGETRLALDAAVPQTPEPCPAIIVVHGGGWVRGDRRIDVQPLLNPLLDAGFAWFSISYRLMNDVTQFGAAVEDVEAAIRFVRDHAAEYRIDPDRIALSVNRRAANWLLWLP